MFFTPRALFRDVSGIIDLVIFIVSLVWLCWMPKHIAPNSAAQALILLRCFRPLRIFNLVSFIFYDYLTFVSIGGGIIPISPIDTKGDQ